MTLPADPTSVADLQRDQTRLLEALFASNEKARRQAGMSQNLERDSARTALAERGLQAYLANAGALAERVLAATYPVLAQLVGDESFASLARHLWRQAPPLRGDVGQWGAELAGFLDASPQLSDAPFLADVARVEWALHCAATVTDSALDAASFALLASANPEHVTLTLSKGVMLLASAFPVVSLVHSHLHAKPALAQVAGLLGAGVREHAVVWRQGFKPMLRSPDAAEFALLTGLKAGWPLEAALAASSSADAFDFNGWLTEAVHSGLVTGARTVDSSSTLPAEASR